MPVFSMALADLVLGVHPTMLWVYASLMVVSAYASWLGKRGFFGLALTSLVSSCLFFVISNFGVWISGGLYPPTMQGLSQAYLMAVPFLSNQLLGDLVWTFLLSAVVERVFKGSSKIVVTQPG